MKKKSKKQQKEKVKRDKHGLRLKLPPHKVHKTKKDYVRKNKVKVQDVDTE